MKSSFPGINPRHLELKGTVKDPARVFQEDTCVINKRMLAVTPHSARKAHAPRSLRDGH